MKSFIPVFTLINRIEVSGFPSSYLQAGLLRWYTCVILHPAWKRDSDPESSSLFSIFTFYYVAWGTELANQLDLQPETTPAPLYWFLTFI